MYLILISLLINTLLLNAAFAELDANNHKGFNKGVSWKPIVPMKKVTFIL